MPETDARQELAAELKGAVKGLHEAKANLSGAIYKALRSGWSRTEIAKGAGVGVKWLRTYMKSVEESDEPVSEP
jgi:hypothetical protein